MKKVIFTLLTITLTYLGASAQYCGASGSNVCIPSGVLVLPGLSPISDSLDPVINGAVANTVIQFKNFDTTRFQNNLLHIDSLKVDSIGNLPAGLCWATSSPNNQWKRTEDGCIRVSGTTCADPGQYKLRIFVIVWTQELGKLGNPGAGLNADAAGLRYYVRVINSGDAAVKVDTSQTGLNPFIKPAGYSASAACGGTGINETNDAVTTLNVIPNPFNNKAVVSFFSAKSMVVTERMTNMLGAEVYKNQLDVKAGENSSVINRNDLPAGVYFYSIADNKNVVAVKRIVVSE